MILHSMARKALTCWKSKFIPAKQLGHIRMYLGARGAPEKSAGESAQEYHERLRSYLEEHLKQVSGFVLYDEKTTIS